MSETNIIYTTIAKQAVATVADLASLDLSRPAMYRALAVLLDEGRIVRVRRGAYQVAEAMNESDSWVQVMQRYPQGVLCLLSALAFHELTTQSPPVVWLALPKSAWHKAEAYPPLRILHYSGVAFTAGIELHQRQGGTVRVYSVAKTVADGFKFRNRIGLDVAIEALREGWQQRRFTLDELDAMARVCRVQAVMRPYIEALVA
ncbi:MAG: type IV toxin-antitoxin system AbiEi family antitoxin domain-containing protein [Gallionellaceae bacterium]